MTAEVDRAGVRADRPRPLWLLDVDGVLNALRVDVPGDHRRFPARTQGRTFVITYRPALMARIHTLHDQGVVEIRWLTTWCEDAATAIASRVDLPAFAVEGAEDYRTDTGSHWWKATVARRLVNQNPSRPLIWTDDDLDWGHEIGELDWLVDHPARLVISPDPALGLTDAALEDIGRFCEATG